MWEQLFLDVLGLGIIRDSKADDTTLPEPTYYSLNPSNELMAIVEDACEDIEVFKEQGLHYNTICEKVSNAYPALHITYSEAGICIEALH